MKLLWLEETPAQGGLKEKREAIRAHVATGRKTSYHARKLQLPSAATRIAGKPWSSVIHASHNVPLVHNASACPKCLSKPVKSRKSTSCEHDGCNLKSRARKSSPLTTVAYIFNAGSDPFGCLAVPITDGIRNTLQYYLSFQVTYMNRGELITDPKPVEKQRDFPMIQAAMRRCLEDEMSCYALLSATAAKMSSIPFGQSSCARQADFFMSRALRTLHDRLNQPDGDLPGLVSCITSICTAEWFRGNFEAVKLHLCMLRRILDWHPEVDLDTDPRTTVKAHYIYDVFIAAETGSSTMFPLTWGPTTLTPDQRDELLSRRDAVTKRSKLKAASATLKRPKTLSMTAEDLVQGEYSVFSGAVSIYLALEKRALEIIRRDGNVRACDGLAENAVEGNFSEELCRLILDDLMPWTDLNFLFLAERYCPEWDGARWNKMAVVMMHKLVGLRNVEECDSAPKAREQATVCILIMLLCDLVSPMAARSVRANVPRLKLVIEGLEAAEPSFEKAYCPSQMEGRLMQWVLNFGISAATSTPGADVEFFASRAIQLALLLQIYDWSDMFCVMARFPKRGLMHQACMVDLIERIGQQRDSRAVRGDLTIRPASRSRISEGNEGLNYNDRSEVSERDQDTLMQAYGVYVGCTSTQLEQAQEQQPPTLLTLSSADRKRALNNLDPAESSWLLPAQGVMRDKHLESQKDQDETSYGLPGETARWQVKVDRARPIRHGYRDHRSNNLDPKSFLWVPPVAD